MNWLSVKARLHSLWKRFWWQPLKTASTIVLIAGLASLLLAVPPASANLNDDRFDGNIYIIYAGNGSLVPSKLTLAESLQQKRPAILVFYIDDSRDSKEYSLVVSRIQEYYGRAATIIPVTVDSLDRQGNPSPMEPEYYYKGFVPQVVILDGEGNVVLDEIGQVPYERVDDVLREVFDLLPRSESVELKRRSFNEFNAELRQ